CEPAYLAAPSDSATARPGSLLTLERSVTIASGHSRSAATTVSLTAEGGTATTTKPGAPSGPGRPAPSDTAVSTFSARTSDNCTSMSCSRNASASQVPMSPPPMTYTRG